MMIPFCPQKEQSVLVDSSLQTIDFQYVNSIALFGADLWDSASPEDNVFLQYTYLSLIERVPPKGMSFAYLIFFQHKKPIGVAYFQVQLFDVTESLSASVEQGSLPKWSENITKRLNFNTLVLGNLLLTGRHGFYFHPDCSESEISAKIKEGVEFVTIQLEKEGRRAPLRFVKDFEEHQTQFLENSYHELEFFPNMILPIRENWKTSDDYLNEMSTKYRTRAKRAFKKMDGLVRLELDEMLMERHKEEIYNLYLRIAKGVGFNLLELHPDYFLEMRKNFGDALEIWGVFDQNKLIGFYTTLHNYEELETGFLGFEEQYNGSHQLYLNMLYDMVRQGIEKGVKRIVFARTAMEIKSSIGAEPFEMHTYVKHNNRLINSALPRIIKWLSPNAEWVQRKPFKE
jgi:hypothetical protein